MSVVDPFDAIGGSVVSAQTERADPEVVSETQDKDPFAVIGGDYKGGGTAAFKEPDSTETQSGDAWKGFKAGVQSGVVGPLLAGAGYLARGAHAENVETILKNLGASSKEIEEENIAEMSPAARKSTQASVLDPEFWAAPLRGIGYKSANMAAGLLAQIGPALLFANPITATGAVAVTGGVFSAGDYIKQVNEAIDRATPEMLATVPFYRDRRAEGMSDQEARARLNDEVQGNGPLINLVMGATANAVGPAGGLARAARGGAGSLLAAGRTLPGRVAAGGIEGAVVNTGQAVAENATVQNALIDNGLQDGFDYVQAARTGADAAAMGVTLGGGVGVVSAGHPSIARPEVGRGLPENIRPENRATTPEITATAEAAQPTPAGIQVVGEKDPAVAEAAALAASAPPAAPKADPAARNVTPDEVVPASEKVTPNPDVAQPVAPNELARPAEAAPAARVETPDNVDPFSSIERVNDRGGRILMAKDAEAEHNLAAQRAEQEANLASLNEKPPGEREVRTAEDYSPKDAKRRDERDRQATVAETIFDAVPDRVYPKTEADRKALSVELGKVLDIAKSEKINVKAIKGSETQSDHMIWLRDAYDLKTILDKKNVTQKARETRDARILAFLSDEKIAKESGDFAPMRERRRVEGEEKMGRKGKGSAIDQVADTKEASPDAGTKIDEKTIEAQNTESEVGGDVTLRGNESQIGTEDVETKVAGSASSTKGDGVVRGINAPGFGEGGIYGAGKKVEITDELKAKYNKPGVVAAKERIAAAAEKVRTTKKVAENPLVAAIKRATQADLPAKELNQVTELLDQAQKNAKAGKDKEYRTQIEAAHAILDANKKPIKVEKETVVESAKRSAAEEAELAKLMGEQAAENAPSGIANELDANQRGKSQGPTVEEVFTKLRELAGMDIPGLPKEEHKPLPPDSELGGAGHFYPDRHSHDDHSVIMTLHSDTVGKILTKADWKALPQDHIASKLSPFLAKHLTKIIGDTPIHFLTAEQMKKLDPDEPLGLAHSTRHANGKPIGDRRDWIAISLDGHKTTSEVLHTIMHEAVHIATVRELRTNQVFYSAVKHIADSTHKYWMDRGIDVADFHQNDVGNLVRVNYGYENAKEFIAEAFSNPKFQKLLAETPIDDYTARVAGLMEYRKPTLWDWFVASIAKFLRMGDARDGHSALEATIRLGKGIMDVQQTHEKLGHLPEYKPKREDKLQFDYRSDLSARRGDALEHTREIVNDFATNSGSHVRKLKNSLSSFIMMTQRAEHVLPGSELIAKHMTEMDKERHRILTEEGGLKITQDIADHEREHGVESRQKVTGLGFDASEANVNLGAGANNSHLGKDATEGWQAKARLKDLEARYQGLLPHEKKLFDEIGAYYRKVQNDLSLQLIKNTLADLQLNEPGLAERIHRDGLTDADKEKLKTNTAVNALNEMRELKKIEGYYIPFARYGDWVVNSYSKLEAPKGAFKVDGQDDTVRFIGQGGSNTDARNRARGFVENHNLKHIDTKKVWVDKLDPSRELEPEDVRAVPAYDVTMQRQSTQFFENEAEARRVQTEMDGDKAGLGLDKVDGVVRKYDFMAKNPDGLSGHMATVWSALEKQEKYQRMSSDERAAVRQTLNEATLRLRGPTRLQAQFLQRRNVAGYSTDAGRVTANYARASAGYLARLRKQPALDAAFDNLKKYINDHKFESNDRTIKRSEFYNEMLKRTYQQEPVDQTALGRASKRLLQISRLDKLAGVSFHVINAQEPWTTSLPVIGGRHGMIRAGRALAQAYNMIGGRGAITAGLRDTMKAYRTDGGFTDYLRMFKDNINSSPAMGDAKKSRFGDLIDYLDQRGIVSDSAVFEVDRYSNPSSNMVGRALDRADLMANQVGTAVEKINRVVTALAAYELEFNRTGNHEGAMHYAYEVTHDTMGDYSTWNSPSAFKHPLGALALQFKKFALKSYYLLGKTMQGAIAGDREAAKQFIGLMATHALVAGALGVPGMEPIKVALMASNVLGITGFTWDDFELAVRAKSAELLGMKGGEVFSKGMYRLAGVEVSSRLGMDNLATQPGGIRDPQKIDDIYAYLAKTMFGASASYIMDQAKMAQALQKGDLAKAAELFVPFKGISDVIKAGSGQNPRLDAKGREIGQAYTPYETVLRAVGFQPSSEAENFAKRAGVATQTKKQTQARTAMIDGWVNAKGGGKDAQLRAIHEWNKTAPHGTEIVMKDLLRAQQSRKDNPTGMKKTDRNANVYDRLAPIFGN